MAHEIGGNKTPQKPLSYVAIQIAVATVSNITNWNIHIAWSRNKKQQFTIKKKGVLYFARSALKKSLVSVAFVEVTVCSGLNNACASVHLRHTVTKWDTEVNE